MISIPFASQYRQFNNWLFAYPCRYEIVDSLDEFTNAYLEACLWAETDNADDSRGEPLDKRHTPCDFSAEALRLAIHDCWLFQKQNAHLFAPDNYRLPVEYSIKAQAGHDFWLSRNGHGAGYNDGDWDESVGELLTAAAKSFDEINVVVGDDGQLYFY